MPTCSKAQLIYRLLEPGANVSLIEAAVVYLSPIWFFTLSGDWGDKFLWLIFCNAVCQLLMFTCVVQIPTYRTGLMSYVDIGWPLGLCIIAANAMRGGGMGYRPFLVPAILMLHGGRMFTAMLSTHGVPFEQDLPRYVYARTRFIRHTGAESLWWIKQQHDTLGQCMANTLCLSVPIFLACTNKREELNKMEYIGLVGWQLAYAFENWADYSKQMFEQTAKAKGDSTAVLGHPPYHTGPYMIWSWCRHPNYFGEWCCWISFCLIALPSAAEFGATQQGLIAREGVWVVLALIPRMLYDCLVHWTGAAPAESRSVQKRPGFKAYQESTRVFFPFDVPCINHHKTPGWPEVEAATELQDEKKKD